MQLGHDMSTMAAQLSDLPLELLTHLMTFVECPCDVIRAGRACRALRAVADTLLAHQASRVQLPVAQPPLAGSRSSLPAMSVRTVRSLTELELRLNVHCAGRVVTCNIHWPGDPRHNDLVSSRTSHDDGLPSIQLAPSAPLHCFPDWASVRALVLDYRSATVWTPVRTMSDRLATGIESLASLSSLSNITHLTVYSSQVYLDHVLQLLDHVSGKLHHLNFRDASTSKIDLSSYQFPRLKSLLIDIYGEVDLPKNLPALVRFDCCALNAEWLLVRIVRCAPRIVSVNLEELFGLDRLHIGFDHPASAAIDSSRGTDSDSSSGDEDDEDSGSETGIPLSQRIWSTVTLPMALSHLSLPPNVRLSKLAPSPNVTHLEISGQDRLTSATASKFPNLVMLSLPELTFTTINALQQSSFASSLTHLTIREDMFDHFRTKPAPVLLLPNLIHVHADHGLFLSANLDAPSLTSTILDLQGVRDAHQTILARILACYPRLSHIQLQWFGAWASKKPPQLSFVLPHHEQRELHLDACPTAAALAGRVTHLDIPAEFTYLIPDCRGLHELIIRVPSLNPQLDLRKWAKAVVGGRVFSNLSAMTLVLAQQTDENTAIQVDPCRIMGIALSPACPRLVSFSVQASLDLVSRSLATPSKAPLTIAWNGALSLSQWSTIIGQLCNGLRWNAEVQQRAVRNGVRVRVADAGRVDARGMLDGLAKLVGHKFREKLTVMQRKGVGRITFEVVGDGAGAPGDGLNQVLEKLKRCHYPTKVVAL